MALSKDWREFLELLNSRGVDYVIVGAQSLAFHGRPRHTGDLDILVRPNRDNARLLLALLKDFGFEQSGFEETDFLQPQQIIQLGRVPSRIDLLTTISGVSTNEAFASKIAAALDGIPVFILGKEALIRNKRAVGRPQDLADIAALEA
ncbi:MAG TPA: nucleotidyltransferase [Candidatus Udaeobacter sp.]|jgi:predicted nucleotidyltransferase|nr:nucleotidyltransferase [Candidatus Udaeobacter sp.]